VTPDRALKVMNWSVAAIVASGLVLGVGSCQGLWGSVKSAAAPAGGAAGGAAVGSLAGPGGAIVGAGIGAVVGNGLEENASLRSGETIGEDALKKEQVRWNGRTRKCAEQARSHPRRQTGSMPFSGGARL
jgi:hypothetical protein